MLFSILAILICATAALVAPILADGKQWWPRRFVAGVFIAPILAILSFYAFHMATPGWWIASWRTQWVNHPSIATFFVVCFLTDCSLWFAVIWGANALLSCLRHGGNKTFFGQLGCAGSCAFPFSLYTTTGYSRFFGGELFQRSPIRMFGCVSISFLAFVVLVLGICRIIVALWPASGVLEIDRGDAEITTLSLH